MSYSNLNKLSEEKTTGILIDFAHEFLQITNFSDKFRAWFKTMSKLMNGKWNFILTPTKLKSTGASCEIFPESGIIYAPNHDKDISELNLFITISSWAKLGGKNFEEEFDGHIDKDIIQRFSPELLKVARGNSK